MKPDPDDYFTHERELRDRFIDGMFAGMCVTLFLLVLAYLSWRLGHG
jgi:hypothetical protein